MQIELEQRTATTLLSSMCPRLQHDCIWERRQIPCFRTLELDFTDPRFVCLPRQAFSPFQLMVWIPKLCWRLNSFCTLAWEQLLNHAIHQYVLWVELLPGLVKFVQGIPMSKSFSYPRQRILVRRNLGEMVYIRQSSSINRALRRSVRCISKQQNHEVIAYLYLGPMLMCSIRIPK